MPSEGTLPPERQMILPGSPVRFSNCTIAGRELIGVSRHHPSPAARRYDLWTAHCCRRAKVTLTAFSDPFPLGNAALLATALMARVHELLISDCPRQTRPRLARTWKRYAITVRCRAFSAPAARHRS